MYEYHGWVALHDSTYEDDIDNLETKIKIIQAKIDAIKHENHIIDLQGVNGTFFLNISGNFNRKTKLASGVFDLFETIREITPGSYGLLYTRNDDEPNDKSNEFKAWVLKRGTFSAQKDYFLSPCVPAIEDGEDV